MPIKNNLEYQKEYRKQYVRKTKQKKRSRTAYYKKKEFICFDGETEKDNYTLLGNSENYIYNKDGLSTWECLNFLWTEGQKKIKIIFALHFDIQFWIKDLSDENILNLLNGFEVNYYCYRLRYFTKKFLMIRRGKATIYIFDILPFFQKSFLRTVEEMKLDLTDKQKIVLEQGKKLRAKGFKTMSKNQIIEYNRTECEIAEKIADKLRDILINTNMEYEGKKFNLYPQRFYGSGAIAKKILKNLQFEQYAEFENSLPDKVKEFITMSYYGGRFEVFKIGTFQNIYKYDINSAYPHAMRLLKVPKEFKIKSYKKTVLNHFPFVDKNIYLIEYDFTQAKKELFGILPHRRKDGYVLFPKRGKGYFFGIEAKYLNEICKITVGKFYVTKELEVSFHDKLLFPAGFIEEIYNQRQLLKQKDDISEIAYKLLINSLYGKLAQQTGFKQFTNVYTASFITAHCRSQILKVIFENKVFTDIIQISTDGIFVQKELKNIDEGNKLGDWKKDFYKEAQILGSGLYSLTDKKTTYALRGIEVTKENFKKIINKLQKNNSAEIYYKAFIGHKFALANHIKFLQFRLKFTEIKKTVNLYDYQKRYFSNKNGINKISVSYWIDIFNGGKIEMTNKLKKFDEAVELEEEAINITTK